MPRLAPPPASCSRGDMSAESSEALTTAVTEGSAADVEKLLEASPGAATRTAPMNWVVDTVSTPSSRRCMASRTERRSA